MIDVALLLTSSENVEDAVDNDPDLLFKSRTTLVVLLFCFYVMHRSCCAEYSQIFGEK
jgi:hypothetical protein